jgi:hypothetical protein
MFEREIHKAKERLLKLLRSNHVAGNEPYTYWFEISADERIHPFYKRFFEAEVRWWVFEQQMMRAANPRFDYTHERLAYHLLNADHYAVESARFDHQDLAATADLAIKTRFNYIIRPRTTLRWFVFRGEPTKTLQEALLRLDYFSGYDYLLNGFRAWAEQKRHSHTLALSAEAAGTDLNGTRQEIISVVEFDRVLQNVDNDHILDLSPTEFVDLTMPIFHLLLEAQPPAKSPSATSDEIPTSALVIFLDDKGIQPIARELERSIEEEDLRSLNHKGFLWVLSDIIGELERTAAPAYSDHEFEYAHPHNSETDDRAHSSSDGNRAADASALPIADTATVPLAFEAVEHVSPATTPRQAVKLDNIESESIESESIKSESIKSESVESDGIEFAPLPEPLAFAENPIRMGRVTLPTPPTGSSAADSSPRSLFHQRLNAPLREELVHSVFHHSEAEFERVMERLAGASSWRESAALIDEMTEAYRLDPNAAVVQHLRDALYRHYAD